MSEFCESLLQQETDCHFASFDSEDALALGLLIVEIARTEIQKGVAIHIEFDQYPLFTHYMNGTSESNSYWIRAKKNVVQRFGHSSFYMGEWHKAQGTAFHDATGLSKEDFQGEGGSFPLIVDGKGRVGTVTVSGLPGEQDHALAVKAIKRYLAQKTA